MTWIVCLEPGYSESEQLTQTLGDSDNEQVSWITANSDSEQMTQISDLGSDLSDSSV